MEPKGKLFAWSLVKVVIAAVISAAVLALALGSWFSGEIYWSWQLFLIVFVLTVPSISALLGFVVVKEGTAKVVMRMGKPKKYLIQWTGRVIDEDGKVSNGTPPYHFVGGVRWFGFFPIDRIYEYKFEWTGVKVDGTFEAHPEEKKSDVMLKDDVYGLSVVGAEDKGQMPVDVDLTMTARIVHVRKALFDVQNWFETTVNRVTPYVRDFMTHHTYQKLIEDDEIRLDVLVMTALKKDGILRELFNRYGVEVRKLEVRSIGPQEKWVEMTMKKKMAEKDAESASEEVAGVVINAMARRLNMTPEDAQKAIATSPDLQKEFWATVSPLLDKRLSLKMGGKSVHINVQGAQGIDGSILSFLGAINGLSGGSVGSGPSGTPVVPPPATVKPKKNPEDMNAEERAEWADKLRGRKNKQSS